MTDNQTGQGTGIMYPKGSETASLGQPDPRIAALDMIGIQSVKDISTLVDALSTLLQQENAKQFHQDLMDKINAKALRS